MADNYLEKKYEEYRSRKNAGTTTGYGKKKANTLHKTRRVFVTEGTGDLGRVIVKAFRRAGHRVAFGGMDEEAGKLLAEKTGTTFITQISTTRYLWEIACNTCWKIGVTWIYWSIIQVTAK